MNAIDRIELLLKLEKIKKKDLPDLTGIPDTRWRTIFRGSVKIRNEDIEALASLYPSYEYWLHTGKEMPESGQVSPMTNEVKSTG